MAACKITSGIDAPACGDRFTAAGVSRLDVYFFNREDITTFTAGALDKEISALVLASTTQGFKVTFNKETAMGAHEGTFDENGNYYTETFEGKILDESSGVNKSIEDFVDIDLVIIFRSKSGKYYVYGQNSGVKLIGDTFSTGATTGDERGATLSFEGIENQRPNQFFDTDDATTKATLDSYLVPAP